MNFAKPIRTVFYGTLSERTGSICNVWPKPAIKSSAQI